MPTATLSAVAAYTLRVPAPGNRGRPRPPKSLGAAPPTLQTVSPERPKQTEKTKQGFEVPIPRRGEFFDSLKKSAGDKRPESDSASGPEK